LTTVKSGKGSGLRKHGRQGRKVSGNSRLGFTKLQFARLPTFALFSGSPNRKLARVPAIFQFSEKGKYGHPGRGMRRYGNENY
jgi:hypothetical protein